MPAPPKRRAGRPKKKGNLPLAGETLEIHERLRLAGMGRNEAIKQTVAECRKQWPHEPISETWVKNVLAQWQPESEFLFEVGRPGNWQPGVFRVVKVNENTWGLRFGPRPGFGKRGWQKKRIKNF